MSFLPSFLPKEAKAAEKAKGVQKVEKARGGRAEGGQDRARMTTVAVAVGIHTLVETIVPPEKLAATKEAVALDTTMV
jgi:hypothetical protein